MASHQTHILPTEPQLTLVDIEELRKILGAEADLGVDSDSDPLVAKATTSSYTTMCPKHPWDQ